METNIDDGRSSVFRPLSGFLRRSIQEPVRIDIGDDEKLPISAPLAVNEIPKSSQSNLLSPQKGCSQCEKILSLIVIILSVTLVAMVLLYIMNTNKVFEGCTSTSSSTSALKSDVNKTSATVPNEMATTKLEQADTDVMPTTASPDILNQTTNITTQQITSSEMTHVNESAETIIPEAYYEIGQTIHSYIDYSIDPCDDFYQFAGGAFIKMAKSLGYNSVNFINYVSNNVDKKQNASYNQPIQDDDLQSIRKTKLFYKACLDIDNINQRGVDPLKDLLINDLGGWPLTYGEWNESNFDIVTNLVKVNLLGKLPILAFGLLRDPKDSHRKRMAIEEPAFILPDRNYYLGDRNNTQLMAYEQYITEVATFLGLADNTTSSEDIKAIVDFEIKLNDISGTVASKRDSLNIYNPMTLDDVQGNYSQIIDWTRYVETLMSLPDVQINITNQDIILNRAPLYFEKLANLISNTTKRTIANYMIWTLVYRYILLGMVGTIFNDTFHKFQKAVPGLFPYNDWQKLCRATTQMAFPLADGRMFVEQHFDKEAKAVALDMVKELKKAFTELLKESDWLDEQTKQYAEEKKNEMVTKIGYPDYIYNDTYIDEVYSELDVGKKYFENMISLNHYTFVNHLRGLRKLYNREEWFARVTEVNAFYFPPSNEIIFPAGVLQKPFFSKTYPMSINFGRIGSIIGHEITHGFDDQGRHYGKDGNLHDWWSNEAEKKFKYKTQCMIDQYGNFVYEPSQIKANGVQTLGENIADNGGLRQAFRAYRNWVKSRGKEEIALPGLNFTHNQLFFIGYAQAWLKMKPDTEAEFNINTDVHSLSQFRVRGCIQNSEDFAKVFNCPVNSPMNPSIKCQVW